VSSPEEELERIRQRVATERAAQGLPPTVKAAEPLRTIAEILRRLWGEERRMK
jgi:hypothetical protein